MSSSLLFPRNISLSAAPICAAALTDPSRPANTRHQDEDFCNTTAARRATGSPWSATSPIRVQRRTSPSLARPYACIVPPSSRPRPFSQPRHTQPTFSTLGRLVSPSLLSRLLKMQVRRSRLHRRGFRLYRRVAAIRVHRLSHLAKQHGRVRQARIEKRANSTRLTKASTQLTVVERP